MEVAFGQVPGGDGGRAEGWQKSGVGKEFMFFLKLTHVLNLAIRLLKSPGLMYLESFLQKGMKINR